MKKRVAALTLVSLCLLAPLSALSGCGTQEEIRLRVYSWEEYIDEGAELGESGEFEGTFLADCPDAIDEQYQNWYRQSMGTDIDVSRRMIDDFELWYEKKYGVPITVEYSTFGTNEDMYNQLKLGDSYDLLCPSEYMIMKLAAENMLEPYSDNFHDKTNADNAYAINVSPFISNVFDSHTVQVTDANGVKTEHQWSDYAAGFMWGTTGIIYNPQKVNAADLTSWDILLNPTYQKKATTKDNVRDTYFVGLAILFEDELLALKAQRDAEEISDGEYTEQIASIMNRTDENTIQKVQEILLRMKDNIYGFETDTGKSDMIKQTIYLNFAWSGDAVYAMDLAEEAGVELSYFVPNECANLWFDGWVMPKGAQKQAAEAFVNFLSMPQNAMRNSYYIGYTSVIASDEMFSYADYMYGSEEGTESYDLSYFFGEGEHTLTVDESQLSRQLFAQYPTQEVMLRCAVMDYFDADTNDRINELWTKIKGATLDAWTIIVICVVTVVAIGFMLVMKFGNKLDLFQRKPKKGYQLVKQERLN